jgi:hypothetical protein
VETAKIAENFPITIRWIVAGVRADVKGRLASTP